MVRGVGLDRIVESNINRNTPPDFDEKRRLFLKWTLASLSILAGIKVAGCSSRGSGSVEFKPQNPLQSGYRLIYPKNSEPVPDDVIPHIEEIGKKYFEVWAPGDLNVFIKDKSSKKGYREIPAKAVTPDMVILGLSSKNNYCWVVGDDEAYDNPKTGYKPVNLAFQHIKDLASDIYFVNQSMSTYGLLFIPGVSGDKAYASFTFIEQGHGKVTSLVYEINLNDPKKYNRYAFHSKEKLNKMWIEITSAQRISEIPNDVGGGKFGVKPEEWYKIPDEASKKWLPV